MIAHHQLRLMEKHIPDKHPEKKPIHYLVRNVDPDGIPSARYTFILLKLVINYEGL